MHSQFAFKKKNSCPITCTHSLHLQGKRVISCITCQHAYTEKYFKACTHSLHSKENLFPITCTRSLHLQENFHLITCIYMLACIKKKIASRHAPTCISSKYKKIKNAPSTAFYHIHHFIICIYASTCIHQKNMRIKKYTSHVISTHHENPPTACI